MKGVPRRPTGSLPLFCMVQAAGPVDRDVTLAVVDAPRAVNGGPGVHRAEVKQALERGAVVANAVLGKQRLHLFVRLRCEPLQKLNVLPGVELAQLRWVRLP